MLSKFLLLILFVSFFLVSCAPSKTSFQDKEYLQNKKYLESYVKRNERESLVLKQETERYDRGSGQKRKEILVKVDTDLLERELKRTLDKRKVETSMVPSPPVPIIVPAKVVRVLIYPYVDSDGNFHGPSYLYTEIEKSRWVVGEFNNPDDSGYGKSFTILEK